MQDPTALLEGVRILAFTQVAVGPCAVQLLSDLGAEVIKVERPGTGAWERRWSGPGVFPGGESLFFLSLNRNCRSVTVDLQHPKGREVVYRLVEQVDAVVENFRPGVMERLGLGYEDLARRNPRLVYCRVSGWGPTGPYRDLPGQDLLLQAETGLASLTGRRGDPPTPAGVPAVDYHTGALTAFALVSALYARGHTGRGMLVETSLLEGALHLQQEALAFLLNGGHLRERSERAIASRYHPAPYGVYRTRRGWLALSLADLSALADALDLPALRDLPPGTAERDPDRVHALIEPALEADEAETWTERLRARGLWCAVVRDPSEVPGHPQVRAMDAFLSFAHPRAGEVRLVRHPVRYDGVAPPVRRRPPLLGEHTEEVLREAGFTPEEVSALRQEGVI